MIAETIDYDRQDSGMAPGERGTPYTMDEAKALCDQGTVEPLYAREIIEFLIRRVERLEKEHKSG